MIVTGLDGKTYKWNYSKYHNRKQRKGKSSYHSSARQLLESVYTNHPIYEEVTLPGCGLYADFWLPSLKIVVEVHGEQHYKHIPRFHKTYADFLKAQYKDKQKREWCELNSITYKELPFYDQENWKDLLHE